MPVALLFFYPLIMVGSLLIFQHFLEQKEFNNCIKAFLLSVLFTFIWKLLFGFMDFFPYRHPDPRAVFFYYLTIGKMGVLQWFFIGGLYYFFRRWNFVDWKNSAFAVWTIVLGINSVESVFQYIRLEIPNSIFELFTPFLVVLFSIFLISMGVVKAKKEDSKNKKFSFIILCLFSSLLLAAFFQTLYFYHNYWHYASIVPLILFVFLFRKELPFYRAAEFLTLQKRKIWKR